jgi:hypothetical protein
VAADVRCLTPRYTRTGKLANFFRNLVTWLRGELDLPDLSRPGSAARPHDPGVRLRAGPLARWRPDPSAHATNPFGPQPGQFPISPHALTPWRSPPQTKPHSAHLAPGTTVRLNFLRSASTAHRHYRRRTNTPAPRASKTEWTRSASHHGKRHYSQRPAATASHLMTYDSADYAFYRVSSEARTLGAHISQILAHTAGLHAGSHVSAAVLRAPSGGYRRADGRFPRHRRDHRQV